MSLDPLEEVCSVNNVEEYYMFSVFFFPGWTSKCHRHDCYISNYLSFASLIGNGAVGWKKSSNVTFRFFISVPGVAPILCKS